MKISELGGGIHKKLWDIQRTVRPIAKRSLEGDDGSRFTPADEVYVEVRRQLGLKQVMAVPIHVRTEVIENAKRLTHLTVAFKDLDTAEQIIADSVGESDDAAGSLTNALKNLYLATFLIPTVDPAEDRNKQRRDKVRTAPPVSSSQIRNFIEPAIKEAGISDDDLSALLLDRFGVDALVKLPRASADGLVKAIRANGAPA